MNIALEKQLCRDFPHLYAGLAKRTMHHVEELFGKDLRNMELVTAFGIEHGDGWYDIVRTFAEIAEPHCEKTGAHVIQQKEKFGALTIYMEGSSKEIFEAIEVAEKASESICEKCGAPATLRESKSGWWSTLCSDCGLPAMQYLNRRSNIERLMHYIIEPRFPNDVKRLRALLLNRLDDGDSKS